MTRIRFIHPRALRLPHARDNRAHRIERHVLGGANGVIRKISETDFGDEFG